MGKGRKKRGPRIGDGGSLPSSDDRFGTGPSLVTEAIFKGGSSSSAMPKKASSSVPCRYFQRGFCWNGDYCRFEHSEGPNTAPSLNPTAPPKKDRAPEECLDWYVTGSCPRLRTCRYAHPSNMKQHPFNMKQDGVRYGSRKPPGMGLDGFDLMLDEVIRRGLDGSGYGLFNDERMGNCGFTDDDVYELSLQGIKPWDPEAADALAVLNGDDYDYGYDYDDYSDYGF